MLPIQKEFPVDALQEVVRMFRAKTLLADEKALACQCLVTIESYGLYTAFGAPGEVRPPVVSAMALQPDDLTDEQAMAVIEAELAARDQPGLMRSIPFPTRLVLKWAAKVLLLLLEAA